MTDTQAADAEAAHGHAGQADAAVAQAGGAQAPHASFFHLAGVDLTDTCCRGTACFVARRRDPDRWARAQEGPRVHCLGKCYEAPAMADAVDSNGSARSATAGTRPLVGVASSMPVVLERIIDGGARTLDDYTDRGGLVGLRLALTTDPDETVHDVEASGLRGRGGAGFPTGRKWRAVRHYHQQHAGRAFVVCNADEGDPGAYIDRILLEDDPFAVLEGMAIAAHAVGASHGIVYVRREYPAARDAIRRAVAEATAAGILGASSPVTGQGFRVEVVEGEGSYVCGEETALLNALEGRRPEVRVRPPYPAEHGLWGAPTLVDNVETLANVAWIARNGGAAYAALGRGESRGTKVVSLNSLFRRPGLYEVEFGRPVREIVEDLGGGLAGGAVLKGLLIGGPLTGILPPHLLDTPFTFEDLRRVGADVGHGGIVAFDENTSIPELVQHVFEFGAFESCGKCTPCRVGTGRIEALARRMVDGAPLGAADADEWRNLVEALRLASLCGHGTGLAAFAESVTTHYAEELGACFA